LLMTRYREVERKFDADPRAPLPDLSSHDGAVSEAAELELDATYFDTADAQLARHRVTLRRRTGGADAGWHLKLPAGDDERTEVRLPLGRTTRTVPAALAREVRGVVRNRPLVPIATLHTTRTERRLLDAEGNALAIVADDTVRGQRLALAHGTAAMSMWREVEVELVDGDRTFLESVCGRLLAAGLTPSASTSKVSRVLGDVRAARSATPDAVKRAGRGTAGAVLVGYLRGQVDTLVMGDRGARADEADGVRTMLVATGRLRSALATYRPLLNRDHSDPAREELKWLEQLLGRCNRAEVLRWRLKDLVAARPEKFAGGPVGRRTDLELGDRCRAARADLVAALDSERYFRLLDTLDDLVIDPALTLRARAGKGAHKQIPALVGRAARRVDRAARAVANDRNPQARDRGLRQVANSARRARFAAESAVPLVGKPAKRLADRMTSLQHVLGEYRDSLATQALLTELTVACHPGGEDSFTLGLLHAQERARADATLRTYETALGWAATNKARQWTDIH
jgi:inorganic triphosphatase YgiF